MGKKKTLNVRVCIFNKLNLGMVRAQLVTYWLSDACLFVFLFSPSLSFRQGLKTLGVLEKMEMHPDAFSSLFCHKPENLSAEALCDLFTIHPSPDVNEIGGADFWMGYLQDVESECNPFPPPTPPSGLYSPFLGI